MSLKKKAKSVFSFFLRIGLSVGLLIYVFSRIDRESTLKAITSADGAYLSAAGIVFLGINGILLWRWRILIRALDLRAPAASVVKHYFYGLFGNLFLPTAIGGDLIKVVGLFQDSSHKAKVVASVLLDRLSGFASIVLIEVAVLLFGCSIVWEDKTLAGLIVGIGLSSSLCGVILFNERIYGFVSGIFTAVPGLKTGLMKMHYDIALLKQKQRALEGVKAVGISCFSQMLFALCWFLIAKALRQEVTFFPFIVFTPLLCVASSFPSIGGLGVREAGAVYLFSKIGMDAGIAVSMSLINFFFMVLVGAAGGVIYVVTLFTRRLQCDPSDAVHRGAVQS